MNDDAERAPVNGQVVMRRDLVDHEGYVWQAWVTRWDDGRVTIQFNTPDDPEHHAYGEDGPRFAFADVRELFTLAPTTT